MFLYLFFIMGLDPAVWGPHYWFFLHTIALNYPNYPNSVTKRKYYDFIQNFHLFIPVEKHANDFNKLVTEYPISPYLDNRDSFVRWVHFNHNKINERLEKPKITMSKFYIEYYEAYKSKEETFSEYYKIRGRLFYLFVIFLLLSIVYYFYDK